MEKTVIKIRYLRQCVAEKLDPHSLADLQVIVGRVHRMVHSFRGGAGRLASRLGYPSGQVVSNEVALQGDSLAKPSFVDVLLWVRETQDFGVLEYADEFVGRHGFVEPDCGADRVDLLVSACGAGVESSEAVSAVVESMVNGKISFNDLTRIDREADEAIAKWVDVKREAKIMFRESEGGA